MEIDSFNRTLQPKDYGVARCVQIWYIMAMRLLFPVFCFALVLGISIPIIDDWEKTKSAPDHIGIAPDLIKYQVSYGTLALLHGINFRRAITIGFSKIKLKKGKKHVIGLCTYGKNFREIDIDLEFWATASEKSRRSLIYHEMTHCYCTRDHDWGSGIRYPDDQSTISMLIDKIEIHLIHKPVEGFYKDGCPLSIMHPVIVDDDCADNHWADYEQEMLNRCIPYQ
jgi:hypothetical protein